MLLLRVRKRTCFYFPVHIKYIHFPYSTFQAHAMKITVCRFAADYYFPPGLLAKHVPSETAKREKRMRNEVMTGLFFIAVSSLSSSPLFSYSPAPFHFHFSPHPFFVHALTTTAALLPEFEGGRESVCQSFPLPSILSWAADLIVVVVAAAASATLSSGAVEGLFLFVSQCCGGCESHLAFSNHVFWQLFSCKTPAFAVCM